MEKLDRLIISHIDLDACASVVMLDYFDIDYDELIYANYTDYMDQEGIFDYEVLRKYKEVWYTDFTPDKPSMDIMEEEGVRCKIFDHHQKVYDEWLGEYKPNLPEYSYTFDNERCGARIVFDYLRQGHRIPKCVHDFIELVDTYDRWQEESDLFEKASDLNRLMWKMLDYSSRGAYKYFPFVEKLVRKLLTERGGFNFSKSEYALIKKDREREKALTKSAVLKMLVRKDSKGKKFGIIRVKKKVSVICHNILIGRKDLDYIIAINDYKADQPKLSLRSKGFNLLQLKNVSGHENAAGYQDNSKEFIEKLWNGKEVYQIEYEEEEK